MKIVESADGMVQVIELDPTKKYWIVLEEGSRISPKNIGRGQDGLILTRRRGEMIGFIENPGQIIGVICGADQARVSTALHPEEARP